MTKNRADYNGTGWGIANLIESDAGSASDPQIAIDGSRNAVAVWMHDVGTNNIMANIFK